MDTAKEPPAKLMQEFHLPNDELNHQLQAYVDEQLKHEAGLDHHRLRHSNIGGWHSTRELHAKLGDDSPFSRLLLQLFVRFSAPMMQYIRSCHTKFNVEASTNYDWDYTGAWFNVAFQGSYNAPHTHPGSQISAAYYVNTEQPSTEYPFSGRIEFTQDNIQHGFFPTPGTLFLFPGDMLHWVHPYYGTSNRICLSFNAANIRVQP